MEDNRWDDHLRDLLGEYKPGDTPLSPEDPTGDMNPAQPSTNSESTDPVSNSLAEQSWKRIEATLDATDQAFDENMRRRIANYHPPYDPHTWPILLQRFSNHQFLRVKLIMLKVIEVSALVLLLITAIKFGFVTNQQNTEGPLPAPPTQFDPHNQPSHIQQDVEKNNNTQKSKDIFASADDKHASSGSLIVSPAKKKNAFQGAQTNSSTPDNALIKDASLRDVLANADGSTNHSLTSNALDKEAQTDDAGVKAISKATAHLPSIDITAIEGISLPTVGMDIHSAYDNHITDPISGITADIQFVDFVYVPKPKYVKVKQRKYTEFSVLAQSDYNGLRMPEDRLFTSGQQIVFPQQGIKSHGFGGGFTIAIGHPQWALETGIIYSAKDFQPGRQLIVGGVFDNGSVEFEAMRLQLISIPLQYRYRFDQEGRFKMYGLIGGGFNVIAQSDIDVLIKYNFPSLSFGANPNSDPDLAETIKETRRISEHIRDGAPFSTKTFISLNGGAGMEYQISKYKTLFLQGTILYQIPDLQFSNNNGKHLRSVSLQAGVRTPLGK